MEFSVQSLPFAPDQLTGLSESLISGHHQNNYGEAVQRLNAIRRQIAALDPLTTPGFVLNGLKREELGALNSMLLHEIYFDCLGGNGKLTEGGLAEALTAAFGSVERWRAEFVAMGKALSGGSGWVLCSYFPRGGLLINQWGADHTQAVEGIPILALDMYEHSYHQDYGAAAAAYVDAFMANIDWTRVAARYRRAVYAVSDGLGVPVSALHAMRQRTTVLDVRRAAVYATAPDRIAGARWRDPGKVAQWADALPRDRDVAVYCVHGHEVSRGIAVALSARGLKAKYLIGGVEGWKSAQGSVEPIGR
jgi:superoxide dismutase, Fe-Mn family